MGHLDLGLGGNWEAEVMEWLTKSVSVPVWVVFVLGGAGIHVLMSQVLELWALWKGANRED